MTKPLQIEGKRFGKLTVIQRYGSTPHKMATWLCKCDCGNETIVRTSNLTYGRTKSCGCLQKEKASETNSKHKKSGTRLYDIWCHMKSRCYNKNYYYYHKYGGNGITVCDEWKDSFENFQEWAYSTGYNEKLTIDRIDNNKGYCPSNCRWATKQMQATNRSCTHFVNYHDNKDSFSNMCRKLNVSYACIWDRIKRNKITFEEAVDNYEYTPPFVDYYKIRKEKLLTCQGSPQSK